METHRFSILIKIGKMNNKTEMNKMKTSRTSKQDGGFRIKKSDDAIKTNSIKKEGIKMKNSILTILSILAVAVLAVSFSGCLDGGNNPNVIEPIDKPAAIQTVTLYTINDNLVAQIIVQIHGTHSQSIDQDNMTSNVIGNNYYVNIPVIDSSALNTRDFGYETVEIILGKKSQFADGDYKIIVNANTDKMFTSDFKFNNGDLYFYRTAFIESVVVEVVDGKVIVKSTVALAGSAETVDEANISVVGTGTILNNYIGINIPTQVKDGFTTLDIRWRTIDTDIGRLSELVDGIYLVTVNGVEITFAIQNHQLIIE